MAEIVLLFDVGENTVCVGGGGGERERERYRRLGEVEYLHRMPECGRALTQKVQLHPFPHGHRKGVTAPVQSDWVCEEVPHPCEASPQSLVLRCVYVEVVPHASFLVWPLPSGRWHVVAVIAVPTA